MKAGPFERQRKAKLTFAAVAVGLMVSTLLGVMLFFMARTHPRF